MLTIAYNIGHFYNTFTASRAVVMMASQDVVFHKMISKDSKEPRFLLVVEKMITEKNYQRFHLLNSLLILEKCDQSRQSVIIARELLYAYL